MAPVSKEKILPSLKVNTAITACVLPSEKVLTKQDVIQWAMSDDINRDKVRIIYENDEIGIEHSFVTFSDGNTQAVMAVFTFKNGKIFSLETGATNMPK